ncbi:unnamed protein product [Lampetra planeri]
MRAVASGFAGVETARRSWDLLGATLSERRRMSGRSILASGFVCRRSVPPAREGYVTMAVQRFSLRVKASLAV